MNLKQSLILAVAITLIATASWELYWRSKGFHPTVNDEKALWALARKKVETGSKSDVVILGASRAYFDIQVDKWREDTGQEPIQLASTGSSPLPTFHDIVNNTNFSGTVVIGVTPGLFFSTTFPGASPWKRAQSKVEYYEDETYAQKLNFQLSIPLQENLVFMSADEEEWSDDIDLKSLLRNVSIGHRTSDPKMPPFYNFGDVSIPRNISMMPKTVKDTAFANSIIKVWHFFGKGAPPPDKASTMAFFLEDLKKFKARKGTVILVRCPSSGGVRMGEKMGLPREEFWDELVKKAQVKSYHFEDYDQLKNLSCPEESHLSLEDANYFTSEIIKIMKADNALTNL
ncbi:hypothetical protein [Aestuariivivens insulae]|uniref:hypothetical protein n=1 Tax=Aestuariivivens insulae TaxID=1621988 RepID=UPI001F58DDB8|nr:hypothetical protein [Aestuariivivens insulae]